MLNTNHIDDTSEAIADSKQTSEPSHKVAQCVGLDDQLHVLADEGQPVADDDVCAVPDIDREEKRWIRLGKAGVIGAAPEVDESHEMQRLDSNKTGNRAESYANCTWQRHWRWSKGSMYPPGFHASSSPQSQQPPLAPTSM